MEKLVKIEKNGAIKYVDEKDVSDYVAIGWKVVKENANVFNNGLDNFKR